MPLNGFYTHDCPVFSELLGTSKIAFLGLRNVSFWAPQRNLTAAALLRQEGFHLGIRFQCDLAQVGFSEAETGWFPLKTPKSPFCGQLSLALFETSMVLALGGFLAWFSPHNTLPFWGQQVYSHQTRGATFLRLQTFPKAAAWAPRPQSALADAPPQRRCASARASRNAANPAPDLGGDPSGWPKSLRTTLNPWETLFGGIYEGIINNHSRVS